MTAHVTDDRRSAGAFSRLRLAALLTLLALGAAAAITCGGGAEERGQATLQAVPESVGLVIYRDSFAGDIVAEDLDAWQRHRLPLVDTAGFPIAADCTNDGRALAYLTVDFDANVSRLSFTGEGVPDEPIEMQGAGQGIAWAPDGKRIALSKFDPGAAGNSLWLLDVATGEITPLPSTGSPGPPRWSPDGERLVFSSLEGSLSQLFLLEIGASAPVTLTDRIGSAFAPDWSPVGSTLLFSGPDNEGVFQLFAIDADGTNERQVTTSSTSKEAPRWSVDGSLIAFAGTILVPQVSRSPSALHNLAVWVVNADGSDERAITDIAVDARPLGWCLTGPWLDEEWLKE